MKSSKRLLPALLALAISCAGPATVSAVTILGGGSGVLLTSTAGSSVDAFAGTSIPTSHLNDATAGAFYSRDQIDFTGSGDSVTLSHTLSQKRSGVSDDWSYVSGETRFTVGADTTYSLTGAYSALDVGAAGQLYFYVSLIDSTTSSFLFYNNQISQSTVNESFVLGGTGGDRTNLTIGSLTGSLIAGHQYSWYIQAYTEALTFDGGATASGFFQLDIGGGAPAPGVPDGGTTLALLGLGVLSLAACRRQVIRA